MRSLRRQLTLGSRPVGAISSRSSGPRPRSCACVVGNPFRPVAFDPTWRTRSVAGLADVIYAEWVFDRLPILAATLEEAGCNHTGAPAHCREVGPHGRGCWVIDMVLGQG